MKVALLTFPNSTSYGASLQMFAAYQYIKRLGCDVEILNYHNAYMKASKHIEKRHMSKQLDMLKLNMGKLLHARLYSGFGRFEKQLTKYPPKAISDKNALPRLAERYDAVVCGSDQVWNPDITDYDLSYFLDFCDEDTARISYAPSFGVESVNADYGEKIKAELEKFSALSVREQAGQKLIKNISGLDAQLVLDPTLLIDNNEWRSHEKPHRAAQGRYILYYTIRSSARLWQYCLNLSKRTGLKILRIGGNAISSRRKSSDMIKYVCDISPDEWLYLVRNATYVVTNSFHGTAFSINFRKNFFVEYSSLTNSRLTQIVGSFGLEAQVVNNADDMLPLTTDYSKTEELFHKIREESAAFLRNALNNASGENERK